MSKIEWRPELMGMGSTYVPSHLREGLVRYVEQGVRPGNGLTKILECAPINEVFGAVDREVEQHVGSIYRFLYNGVGSPAWGNQDRVAAWIERKGMMGDE